VPRYGGHTRGSGAVTGAAAAAFHALN
jgi:hypothetical protein